MKIINIIKKSLINLLILILLLVLALVIYSFIQINVQKKEYCDLFGYSIFKIETGSMSDVIEIEDIIIVKLGNDNLTENDIITFKQDNNFITHRIIEIDEEKIITKGDSNNKIDDPITKNDVVGKVEYIFTDVRVWKAVFTDVKVIVSCIITLILLVLLVSYKEKVGEKNVW